MASKSKKTINSIGLLENRTIEALLFASEDLIATFELVKFFVYIEGIDGINLPDFKEYVNLNESIRVAENFYETIDPQYSYRFKNILSFEKKQYRIHRCKNELELELHNLLVLDKQFKEGLLDEKNYKIKKSIINDKINLCKRKIEEGSYSVCTTTIENNKKLKSGFISICIDRTIKDIFEIIHEFFHNLNMQNDLDKQNFDRGLEELINARVSQRKIRKYKKKIILKLIIL